MKIKNRIIFMGAVPLLLGIGIANAQQVLLPGALIPKFVEPLPVAGDISVVNATSLAIPGLPAPLGKKPADGVSTLIPINVEEFQAQILPTPANWPAMPAGCVDADQNPRTASSTWGYLVPGDDPDVVRPSYLGPVVVAERDVPAYPQYSNMLPAASVVQANLPIDMTLDWANPTNLDCDFQLNPANGLWEYNNTLCGGFPYTALQGVQPVAAHIHGGEVSPYYDGGPDAWFTQGNLKTGAGWPGSTYEYPNGQQESTIWFHDHALGLTRLNVFAGMAGLYPIIDPALTALHAMMPKFPEYDIPLIIQDRSFDDTCQIFYNLASNPQPNPTVHPFWIPEFIGDTIAVNGKTWPYLNVEPRQYRFRLLNGSNARFYDLSMNKGVKFIAIATDDGYLVNAVQSPNIIIAPGERYEVIVDFSGMKPGTKVTMFNAARTPYPGGAAPVKGTTDTVMQFVVNQPLSEIPDPPTIAAGTPIRSTPYVPIVTGHVPANGSITRQLTLNEVIGPGGPLELVVNNSKFNKTGILPGTPTPIGRETELPALGDTEIWEIINITADAHPMHIHLISFQVLSRTPFQSASWINQYDALLAAGNIAPGDGPPYQYNVLNADGAIGGNPAVGPFLQLSKQRLPLPYENGWKDTVIAYPGEVTKIAVRWATTDTPVNTNYKDIGLTYPFDPTVYAGNPYSTDPIIGGVYGIGYVWHCHIIDHEDNEMMRNYLVGTDRQLVCSSPTTCP